MDPNCPKSLEDIEDIEKVDSDAEHGQDNPNPDPSNADQVSRDNSRRCC